ncbi:hypothetical protein ABIB38_002825 [Massilia sp. UYP11]
MKYLWAAGISRQRTQAGGDGDGDGDAGAMRADLRRGPVR